MPRAYAADRPHHRQPLGVDRHLRIAETRAAQLHQPAQSSYAFDRLTLPLPRQVRMHLVPRCNLLDRAVAIEGLKR